jgi:hypothetical protein
MCILLLSGGTDLLGPNAIDLHMVNMSV